MADSKLFPERGMRLSEGPLPLRDLFPDDEWTAKLAIAPGTVYGNAWEQRITNSRELRVQPVPYAPPYPTDDSRPLAYLDLRSAGVRLGRVTLELRPDIAPLATQNFLQLCAFGLYKGCIFHRIFPDFAVQGGDYTRRCAVVCPPGDPLECFDLAAVPPSVGGRSIYSDREDGCFADEGLGLLPHARGVLSMSNRGIPDSNGSQFFVVIAPAGAPPRHLDGQYTAFGQVVAGYDVLAALGTVGRKDGTTLQRVVCDGCGVTRQGATVTSAASGWGRAHAQAGRRARVGRAAAGWGPWQLTSRRAALLARPCWS
jgi:cyclophilin family peptidyl-prolyl cis-trans isomerase